MQNLIILASKNIKDNDDFMKFYIKRGMEKAIHIAIVICSPLYYNEAKLSTLSCIEKK
jgi:hypothetical protein